MVPEIAIWRAANRLIEKHGADAEFEATRLASQILDRGGDGWQVWARVRLAVEALQAPPSGKPN
jgi:hypothetical protein